MKHILLFALLLCSVSALAQVGINTTSPDSTALLDINYDGSSSSVGVLLPHIDSATRLCLKGKVSDGMLVFDRIEKQLYYYNGTAWVAATPFGAVQDDSGLGNIRPQNEKVNSLNMGLGLPAGEAATAKLDVKGDIRTRDNLVVDKLATIPTLQVSSITALQPLTVNDDMTLKKALTVEGNTTLQSPTTINNTLTVNGNISAENNTINAQTVNAVNGNGIIPLGGIIMWNGVTPPNGWVLRNGAGGTPDLRGQFIVGYHSGDADYSNVGKGGGAKEVTLQPNQMPAHTHALKTERNTPGQGGYDVHRVNMISGAINDAKTEIAGGGQAHENRPPYYVLAFIMRVE